MNKRIFDRSNYSRTTLVTFEVLAAYFIDIYYNHLYLEAKKIRTEKTVNSVTEGYKHALNAFMLGIDTPKLYKKTLFGIHNYFAASGFTSMTFAECIERITKEFIPEDYYSTVSKHQKTSVLKLIVSQSNKTFIEKLVLNFLSPVIDNHAEADNIRMLQDEFIDILMIERENIYHKFVSAQANTNRQSSGVNTAAIEAMRREIKTLCGEKFQLKKLVMDLKKIIIKKDEELKTTSAELLEITKQVEKLEDDAKTRDKTIAELTEQCENLQSVRIGSNMITIDSASDNGSNANSDVIEAYEPYQDTEPDSDPEQDAELNTELVPGLKSDFEKIDQGIEDMSKKNMLSLDDD